MNRLALDNLEALCEFLFGNKDKDAEKEIQKFKAEIQKNRKRLNNAQQLLLDGTLDPAEYKAIKDRYEPMIQQMESRLRGFSQDNSELDRMIEFARKFFSRLDSFYEDGVLSIRQQIIGSMFPEKLIFEKNGFRTTTTHMFFPGSRTFFGGLGVCA